MDWTYIAGKVNHPGHGLERSENYLSDGTAVTLRLQFTLSRFGRGRSRERRQERSRRLKRPTVKSAEGPQGYSHADQDSAKDREPRDDKTGAIAALGLGRNGELAEADKTRLAEGTPADFASPVLVYA